MEYRILVDLNTGETLYGAYRFDNLTTARFEADEELKSCPMIAAVRIENRNASRTLLKTKWDTIWNEKHYINV